MTDAITVKLSELQRRSGYHRTSIKRHLDRKGIHRTGRRVLVSELWSKWPELAEALGLVRPKLELPSCPKCRSATVCQCLECGKIVA